MTRWVFIPLLSCLLATSYAQEERHGDTIEFELKQNIIFVKGTINDHGPYTFIFDTGASVTVIKPKIAEKLDLIHTPPAFEFFGLAPALGTADISLGNAKIKDLEIVSMSVPQADIPLFFAGQEYHGIVGYNFISQFITTIDYKERTLKLEPNDYEPESVLAIPGLTEKRAPQKRTPQTKPRIGFSYRVNAAGEVVITNVAPDSPALKAGLRQGDVILEVNGGPIGIPTDYRKVLETLKPGDRVSFHMRRKDQHLEFDLEVGGR